MKLSPNDERLRKAVLAFLDALFRGPQCQAAVRIWGNPKKAPFLEEMEMKWFYIQIIH